jgi:hypothetical protein
MWRYFVIAGTLLIAGSTALAQPATAPATKPAEINPASVSDLQQMLEDKNFQQVIQQTSRLLALKGSAADAYNRFDLLRIKAEAQLENGDTQGAISTFSELGRVTNDPQDRDVALATVVLIRRSPHGKFTPKTVPAGKDKAQPIDIFDPLTRKAAFEAMFNDERQAIEPKLKSAIASQSLPPILPVIESLLSLRSLDIAASGSDQRTTDLTAKLLSHAKGLMTSALVQMQKRLDDIDKQANAETVTTQIVVINKVPSQVQTRSKQGLSDRNIHDLKDMVTTCGKIGTIAQSFSKVGNAQTDMQGVVTTANEVQSKAKDLLDMKFQ